jgi:hypothetical protein
MSMRNVILDELRLMALAGKTGENVYSDFLKMDDSVLFDAYTTFKYNEGWRHGNNFKFDPSIHESRFDPEHGEIVKKEYRVRESFKMHNYYTVIAESKEEAILMVQNGDGNWIDEGSESEPCEWKVMEL